jgi:hypothetical protein
MNRLHETVLRRFAGLICLALGLLAPTAFAANTADSFEFHNTSGTVAISYASTSFMGVPTLSYTNGAKTLSFSGDQIQVEQTAIGQLVTVTVAIHPDIDFRTLSVLIPQVSVDRNPVSVATRAILTTHHTPFIVNAFVGQQEEYTQVINLKGTADFVVF